MRGEASWIVPPDHPAFAGHFPGHPIVPGVVLLDEALCVVEAACRRSLIPAQISSAKFLRPIGPGQALSIRYEQKANGALGIEILCGSDRVASCSLAAAGQGAT